MSYNKADYYAEYLSDCFCDFKIKVTEEQLKEISEGLLIAIDCESQAFYTPPASDYYAELDREWKRKYDALKKEFDKYTDNAENAVKKALRQPRDANISIGEYGEEMNVWILLGLDAHDAVIIGVFKTKELAEIAKEMNEDSYAFYSIRCWGVTE